MQLILFTEQDYALLVGWIPDEAFNLMWGGPLYAWPISIDKIAAHQAGRNVFSLLLVDAGEKVGFIELVRESESHCRLCRVLIAAKSARGKGYGRQLVELATKYAQHRLGADQLSLAVFEKMSRPFVVIPP